MNESATGVGREVIVDALGCDPDGLRSRAALETLFADIIADLALRPLDACWHTFGGPGGVTGLVLLTESHLTVHTFPENGLATINLYCCRPRPDWDWAGQLQRRLGATSVRVSCATRG